jgi:hypothetical protein
MSIEQQLRETSRHMETHRMRDQQMQNAFNLATAFQELRSPVLNNDEIELDGEILDDIGMNDEDFSNAALAMNVDQRDLFNFITQQIRQQIEGSNERIRMFVTGKYVLAHSSAMY